jgi:hypothetical protein
MNHEGSMRSLLLSRIVKREWDGLLECLKTSRLKASQRKRRSLRESLFPELYIGLTIRPSVSGSSSAGSGQASPRPATSSSSSASVPTGAFDVENPSSTVSDAVASATETPNGAGQTTFAGYAGVAAAVIGVYAVL